MLDSIWQFLKESSNIPSIGAGIATVLGGAWAVFTFFARKSEKDPPAPNVTNISADHGSFAAGHIAGSVTIKGRLCSKSLRPKTRDTTEF